MRIGRYRQATAERSWCGARLPTGQVVDLPAAGKSAGLDLPGETSCLLEQPDWRSRVEESVEHAETTGTGLVDGGAVEPLAPVDNPGKVVCVGLNYRDHAEEGDNPIPDEPVLFAKFPTAIIGPSSPISWDPDYATKVDYEAELVVVIGREARDVDRDDALDHVAGYTIGNDVSARDLQHGDGQWVRGKSLDTFGPTGPEIVTPDEIDDPHSLDIWTEVNGERLQESTTANLIFGVDELIAFCSRGVHARAR